MSNTEYLGDAIISSQRYVDGDIVAAKSAGRDYTVTLSGPVLVGGAWVRVVLDGHHSLAAAQQDGVAPDYDIADEGSEDGESYLDAHWLDSDWYYIGSGALVF